MDLSYAHLREYCLRAGLGDGAGMARTLLPLHTAVNSRDITQVADATAKLEGGVLGSLLAMVLREQDPLRLVALRLHAQPADERVELLVDVLLASDRESLKTLVADLLQPGDMSVWEALAWLYEEHGPQTRDV